MAADPELVPVHRRTIEFDVYDAGDSVRVVGRLRDLRPWAEDEARTIVHDMELDLEVRRSDFVILAAKATMHTFPHAECPQIEDAFAQMVGLSNRTWLHQGHLRSVRRRSRLLPSRASRPCPRAGGHPGRRQRVLQAVRRRRAPAPHLPAEERSVVEGHALGALRAPLTGRSDGLGRDLGRAQALSLTASTAARGSAIFSASPTTTLTKPAGPR